MGNPNPNNVKATPISFPPGIRFYPTEEQLLCYYLSKKNSCDKHHEHDLCIPSSSHIEISPFGIDMIQEVDLYDYDPWDLPDIARFCYGRGGSKKHWFCFTAKMSSKRVKRKARGGFWKRRGTARDVVGGKEGSVLGKRNTYVFYHRNSSRTMKTDWILHEYALVDNLKDSFTLCRVFFKSCPGNKISEHVPSSCTDKIIAAMHDNDVDVLYKQHSVASASGIGDVLVHTDTSVGTENEIQRLPMNSIGVLAGEHHFPRLILWIREIH
ncbi:hypothetical protein NE237_017464 [Protea cynaroides]|uniref:NAC domain-containing protein n=1 Tax=Protea cynaroides TaxID=273540 RepID=A0A9Q0K843_9MAGN|nr:hypothetical protein NE237_017464 [Protea cynaroides]